MRLNVLDEVLQSCWDWLPRSQAIKASSCFAAATSGRFFVVEVPQLPQRQRGVPAEVVPFRFNREPHNAHLPGCPVPA